MNKLFSKTPLGFLLIFLCDPTFAQEWIKPDAGRSEYVQDRVACANEAQSMALTGEALDKDVAVCLVSKGWQRNLSDNSMPMYCADREAAISCKRGGTEEIYKKDRADCFDQTMKTVGNKYSRPGWRGLGGLIISSIEAEENKNNLRKAQLQSMKICLEGKSWTVEFKGETKTATTYIERNDSPSPRAATTPTPTQPQITEIRRPTQTNFDPPRTEKGGVFELGAQKAALSENCPTNQPTKLTDSGPGFESYSVGCTNDETVAVRCDFGNCRVLK